MSEVIKPTREELAKMFKEKIMGELIPDITPIEREMFCAVVNNHVQNISDMTDENGNHVYTTEQIQQAAQLADVFCNIILDYPPKEELSQVVSELKGCAKESGDSDMPVITSFPNYQMIDAFHKNTLYYSGGIIDD